MSQTSISPLCHFAKYVVGNRHLQQKDPLACLTLMSMSLLPETSTKKLSTNGLLQTVNFVIYQQEKKQAHTQKNRDILNPPCSSPFCLHVMPACDPHLRSCICVDE